MVRAEQDFYAKMVNMAAAPERFPSPGSAAFLALSPEEQSWLGMIWPWFARGTTAGSPTRVMRHPTMDTFRADPRHHLPRLVRYYLTAPMLFEFALVTLTSHKIPASTPQGQQADWAAFLPDYLTSVAAE
jgi:hypothetical protein